MNDLVSILIPAYNAERWIQSTIISALNQTWENKEIIIVDDGSSDKTFQIANRFASRSVKVITQENQGAGSARNHALRYAQGSYIQWLDADDLLSPDKIDLQLKGKEMVDDEEVLLSSAWGKFFFRHEKTKWIRNSLCQDLSPVDWIRTKMSENAWMAIDSWLVSRKLTEMAGPWDERIRLDIDGEYICRVVACSKMVQYVPKAKSYIRTGNSSSISSLANLSDMKLKTQYLSLCSQIRSLLSLEDSVITRSACVDLLQEYLIYFYPDQKEILGEMNGLAGFLGGRLTLPEIQGKYRMIKNVFGWDMAKKARILLPSTKTLVLKNLDKLLYSCSMMHK
ncbi:MAG: hypothetical protein A2W09_04300 [Deltaproteobacteria bacterium RBG_16_50_11]|nr:MAG: hypothetical protein A2W09_04300 [Deltaproteobacteria bacterium RBG_16_50_11]